jgi:hypothetical protein
VSISKEIFQTLENKDNPDYIEQNGPFQCDRKDAWLGKGYYFWESFIENAHWWGEKCPEYQNEYIICKAVYEYDNNKCFNLIDNKEHITIFKNSIELMKEQDMFQKNKTTVSQILHFLQKNIRLFNNFDACRVYGVYSKEKKSNYSLTVPFKTNKPQYLDLCPPIQICFYKKNALNLHNYKIIYPDEYVEGLLV